MSVLTLQYPGILLCAECGYVMSQVNLSPDKRVATMVCAINSDCKNHGKEVKLHAVERVLEDA